MIDTGRGSRWGLRGIAAGGLALVCGCGQSGHRDEAAQAAQLPPSGWFPPERVADFVHTVIEADRATYAEQVVNRLQNVEKRISASEHFREEKLLPLPSQMMRMGAQLAAQKSPFRYALISTWAINKVNTPKTDFEKKALAAIEKTPDVPYRATDTVAGKKYFMAAYADKAVSVACADCHNHHDESPRHDFKLGDVMGGIVVTLPLE